MRPVRYAAAMASLLLIGASAQADSGMPADSGMSPDNQTTRTAQMQSGGGMMNGSGMMNMSRTRHRFVMQNGIPQEYRSNSNPLAASETHIAAGRKLYETHCVACHGASGRGDGPAARNLDPRPTNIARFSKMGMATDAYLYWTIADGGAPLGTAMPPLKGALDEKQIWQLILYVRQM